MAELTKLALLFFLHDITSFVSAAQAAPAGFTDELVVGGLNNRIRHGIRPGRSPFMTLQMDRCGWSRPARCSPSCSPYRRPSGRARSARDQLSSTLRSTASFTSTTLCRGRLRTTELPAPLPMVMRHRRAVRQRSSTSTIFPTAPITTAVGYISARTASFMSRSAKNATSANSQSLANRLGKILRLNDDGSIPSDNPSSFSGITGNPVGDNRAIWRSAYGILSTFAFQPHTGVMMLNDVGERTFEEVALGPAG